MAKTKVSARSVTSKKSAKAKTPAKKVKSPAKKSKVTTHQPKGRAARINKNQTATASSTPEHIKSWLLTHPLINWQGLCRDANVPLDVIKLAVHGRTMKGIYKIMPIPEKHCAAIIAILKDYGYKSASRK